MPYNPYAGRPDPMAGMRSVYKAIVESRNPMQAFQRLASHNPQMKPILQALQSGTDPQQLFNAMCQQRGIDPQEFLRSITGNYGK